MTTQVKATIGIIIFAILLFGSVAYYAHEPKLPPFGGEIKKELKLKAPKEKILESKEVDWIEQVKDKDGRPTGEIINKGRIIKYDYITDKKVIDKFVWFKGKYTNVRISEKPNTEDYFIGDHWAKEGSDVFKIEHRATTTIEAFKEQTKPDLISRIKGLFIAQADTTTSYYAGAGDGRNGTCGGTWSTLRNSTSETAINGGTTAELMSHSNPCITRVSLPIDTSGLPTGAIVSSADLKITQDDYFYDTGGNDIVVVSHTRDDPSGNLIDADYNITNFGTTEYITRDDITGWSSAGGLHTLSLNTAGKTFISDSGYTTFGMLISEDFDNNGGSTLNAIEPRLSEYAGTASDPYLSITYTEPAPADEEWIREVIRLE